VVVGRRCDEVEIEMELAGSRDREKMRWEDEKRR